MRGNQDAELARLRSDLAEMQKQKADAEKRVAALARKNRDAAGIVSGLEKRVEALATDKDALNDLVASYQSIEKELTLEMKQLKMDGALAIAELGKHKAFLEAKLEDAKEAVQRSNDEAFAALENGYNLCWDRAAKAGYDMEPHTFVSHCQEVARSHDEGGNSTVRGRSET